MIHHSHRAVRKSPDLVESTSLGQPHSGHRRQGTNALCAIQVDDIMGRFTHFFRRSAHQKTSASTVSSKEVQDDGSNLEIAAMQVAGMQRNDRGTYITAHTAVRPEAKFSTVSTTSTFSESSQTAVDQSFVSKHGESQWKGRPNGQAYDKREELSAEDKDTWARMAM